MLLRKFKEQMNVRNNNVLSQEKILFNLKIICYMSYDVKECRCIYLTILYKDIFLLISYSQKLFFFIELINPIKKSRLYPLLYSDRSSSLVFNINRIVINYFYLDEFVVKAT